MLVPAGIDTDKDGFFAGQDCNDANAAIRPGATEIKGNRIDENCDGTAEPFQTLPVGCVARVGLQEALGDPDPEVAVDHAAVASGMKVKIFCKGKKCPFKSKNLKLEKAKKGARSVLKSLTAEAAEVPGRADGRGVGERAELQHEGRADAAQEGQGPGGPGAVRRARAVQAAEEVRLKACS